MQHRGTPFRLMALLLAIALLSQSALAQAQEKVINIALNGAIVTLDPANYRNRNTENVIRNMFDGLYTVAPDGRTIPEIAESVTQVGDTVWEFKIREGITFHNGDPLTAEDVAFSYNRVVVEGAMEGETSPRKGLMGSLQEVTVVDDHTVHFHLGAPESELRVLTSSVFMQVIPKAYFESVGVEGFIANPVGAGPFKLVEASYAERIVLDRYDGYWGGAPDLAGTPGPAAIDRIIFEVVPDPASRLAGLRAGDLDIIQGVLADQIPVIEGDANVQLKTGPGTNPIFLAFNTELAPFDNVEVRRALAHAIDYDLIVEAVFGGLADPLYAVPVTWNAEVTHPDLEPYSYDPELAQEMLAAAGASNIQLTIDTIGTNMLLAEAVAQMLREIGLDAQVRSWEAGALLEAVQTSGRQAVIQTWGNASGNPQWPMYPVEPGTGFSVWNSNQEFWDTIKSAPSIVDVAEREAAFRSTYEMVMDEMPFISIAVPQTIEAVRSNVSGFEAHPGGRVNMHRVDLATP
ncbi:MAG TPA: ABC transporter substrate-binding protein [Trueperaceae bacterium]|nr:ABC transporter substrate-binding protein [Trueperaceae bacterium]